MANDPDDYRDDFEAEEEDEEEIEGDVDQGNFLKGIVNKNYYLEGCILCLYILSSQ